MSGWRKPKGVAATDHREGVRSQVGALTGCGLATLGLVLAPAPAIATPRVASVTCGSTITRDTTLDHDLVNCRDGGLSIGADHLTLDLNGHSIDGDGVPADSCPPDQACDVGVMNAGHRGVTIKDGTVTGFSVGIALHGTRQNRIRDVSVSRTAEFGLIVLRSDKTLIERNSLTSTGTSGLVLRDSMRSQVLSNSVSGNRGFGIVLAGVTRTLVQANRVTTSDHGISAQAGSSYNTLRRNLISLSGGSAIDVGGDGAVENRVVQNALTDNGDGIILGDANDSVIDRNVIRATGARQPDARGFGIRLDGSDRNLISRNAVTGGRGPAITITSEEFPTPADHNVVRRNLAGHSSTDGILIERNATHTLLVRNSARRNGSDGIDVRDSSTILTGNRAYANEELGIRAVPGVTDGGRNRASANGSPDQCLNITCGRG